MCDTDLVRNPDNNNPLWIKLLYFRPLDSIFPVEMFSLQLLLYPLSLCGIIICSFFVDRSSLHFPYGEEIKLSLLLLLLDRSEDCVLAINGIEFE